MRPDQSSTSSQTAKTLKIEASQVMWVFYRGAFSPQFCTQLAKDCCALAANQPLCYQYTWVCLGTDQGSKTNLCSAFQKLCCHFKHSRPQHFVQVPKKSLIRRSCLLSQGLESSWASQGRHLVVALKQSKEAWFSHYFKVSNFSILSMTSKIWGFPGEAVVKRNRFWLVGIPGRWLRKWFILYCVPQRNEKLPSFHCLVPMKQSRCQAEGSVFIFY